MGRVAAHLRRLPVIVLTSSAEGADIDLACDLGANSYLVKPSDIDESVELAAALCHIWLDRNRKPQLARPTVDASETLE